MKGYRCLLVMPLREVRERRVLTPAAYAMPLAPELCLCLPASIPASIPLYNAGLTSHLLTAWQCFLEDNVPCLQVRECGLIQQRKKRKISCKGEDVHWLPQREESILLCQNS